MTACGPLLTRFSPTVTKLVRSVRSCVRRALMGSGTIAIGTNTAGKPTAITNAQMSSKTATTVELVAISVPLDRSVTTGNVTSPAKKDSQTVLESVSTYKMTAKTVARVMASVQKVRSVALVRVGSPVRLD